MPKIIKIFVDTIIGTIKTHFFFQLYTYLEIIGIYVNINLKFVKYILIRTILVCIL